MRKNLSREGGKKFVYNTCQRPTFFWQRKFIQELQNGHKDLLSWITAIIQKSDFCGDQVQPLQRDFVLLHYI